MVTGTVVVIGTWIVVTPPDIVEVIVVAVEIHAMSLRDPRAHVSEVIVVTVAGRVDTLVVKVVVVDSTVLKLVVVAVADEIHEVAMPNYCRIVWFEGRFYSLVQGESSRERRGEK